MNYTSSAYESAERESLDGRQLEASVLTAAGQKLMRCERFWDRRHTPAHQAEWEEALAYSQRLWSFLQVELSNPDHSLAPTLRRDLVRLSRFVDQTILRLYAGGTLEDLRSVTRITQEIAAGLSSSPKND